MLKILVVSTVAACSFLGSLVGSHYLQSAPAHAASAKGPSTSVLAARIAALNRRVTEVQNNLTTRDDAFAYNLQGLHTSFDSMQNTVNGLYTTVNGTGFTSGMKGDVAGLKRALRDICSELNQKASFTILNCAEVPN
jgi:hypothetical protein